MSQTGQLTFTKIKEADELEFNPPLVVNYTIEKNGLGVLRAFISYDFGMDDEIPVSPEHNFLCSGYQDLTKESDPVDVLRKTIEFDLFHAFTHYEGDPNYTHRHWALKGWLNERVLIHEAPVDFGEGDDGP
jgi:hypothetical protein